MAATEILTLKTLAERWMISEHRCKKVVKSMGVPFIPLSPGELSIRWGEVRFRLDQVEEWEIGASREFDESDPGARPVRQPAIVDEWS
jgi:hypothetical protein